MPARPAGPSSAPPPPPSPASSSALLALLVLWLVWPHTHLYGSFSEIELVEEGRRRGARQQPRRHHRLSRRRRADLGLRRCRHGAAPHAAQIRRGAERRPHLAHRASLRHPRGRRALRLPHRERPVGPARQRPATAPARAARGDRRQGAVRHHPDHRRHDRCRHFERMGRIARRAGGTSVASAPGVDAPRQSRSQYRRPLQSRPHGPAHQPGPALAPIAHAVGHECGPRRSRARGRPGRGAAGRHARRVLEAASRGDRAVCRYRQADPVQGNPRTMGQRLPHDRPAGRRSRARHHPAQLERRHAFLLHQCARHGLGRADARVRYRLRANIRAPPGSSPCITTSWNIPGPPSSFRCASARR